MMVNSYSRFHSDQIMLAMHHLILMMKQRPASTSSWATVSESVKPDVRLDLIVHHSVTQFVNTPSFVHLRRCFTQR